MSVEPEIPAAGMDPEVERSGRMSVGRVFAFGLTAMVILIFVFGWTCQAMMVDRMPVRSQALQTLLPTGPARADGWIQYSVRSEGVRGDVMLPGPLQVPTRVRFSDGQAELFRLSDEREVVLERALVVVRVSSLRRGPMRIGQEGLGRALRVNIEGSEGKTLGEERLFRREIDGVLSVTGEIDFTMEGTERLMIGLAAQRGDELLEVLVFAKASDGEEARALASRVLGSVRIR